MLTPTANGVLVHFSLEDYPKAIADFNEACTSSLTMPTPTLVGGLSALRWETLGFTDDFNQALRQILTTISTTRVWPYLIKDHQGALNDLTEAIRLAPEFASILQRTR